MDEQTNFDQTLVKEQSNGYDEVKATPDAAWKQVVMGGATGILIGTLGSALLKPTPANAAENAETSEAEQKTNDDLPTPIIYSDAPVASSVNDGMTFNEAFAAARSEVGAGGVFTWHGGVYGTYYVNEWNNMSNADRNDFAHSVHQSPTPYHSTPYYAQSHASVDDDVEVHVLGVEHVTVPDGSIAEVAAVEIDGERIALIDIDNDGIVDGMMADINHDGRISADEVRDIEHMGIQMDELRMMDEQNHFTSHEEMNGNNEPDYLLGAYDA